MFPLLSKCFQAHLKLASMLCSGKRVTLAKGVAGWISGPSKIFLLIQQFHKDDKDHIAFPSGPRVLAGAHGWKSGRRAQCKPLQTFAEEVPIKRGLLGKVGRSCRLYPHRVTQESVHMGITQRISLHAGFRAGVAPVKFTDIIWADISFRNRKPQRSHTGPKNQKAKFSGLELGQYFRASETG